MKKYKAGQTIHMITNDYEYDYVLKPEDIKDIAKGEWDEVGFKITHIVKDRPPFFIRMYNYFRKLG